VTVLVSVIEETERILELNFSVFLHFNEALTDCLVQEGLKHWKVPV
jgi:hypothetical protein